jgi:hypothetical protein
MPDERDPSTFYTISRYFCHPLHYIEVGQRGREILWVGGIFYMEQVWCHEQNMAQNISHLNHLIFERLTTHTQEMKLITETAQKNWFI